MAQLLVRRMSYALGAEIRGLDLRSRFDEAVVAEFRRLWLEHHLLCFPQQNLDPLGFMEFAERFGPLETMRKQARIAETPHVGYLSNRALNGKPSNSARAAEHWHTDESYTTQPTSATLLHAKVLPEAGGDTLFANQHMAYEALSPAMQRIVGELSAIQYPPARAERTEIELPVVQPVVRVHPETGRKALYVGARLRRFLGMTDEESEPLLQFLNQHAVRYEITYRHRWTAGDLVMWDNRSVLHRAVGDYDLDRDTRQMLRTGVLGEISGYTYAAQEAGAQQ